MYLNGKSTKKYRHRQKDRQKKSRADLRLLPTILSVDSNMMEITFRDARQKRSTSCDPLHGEKPVHDDHSSMPYAHGNRACSRDGDCAVEMFFSLFYYLIFVIIRQFGLQNYVIISNYASFPAFILDFSSFLRNFAPKFHEIVYTIMINSQDIKKGTAIRMDGSIWVCIDFQHRKPGKGNTIMNIKMKNVTDGRVLERRYNIGEKLEDVVIEHRDYQYLYEDQEGRIFMNQETFEQIPIANDLVIGHEYMKEGDVVSVVSDTTDGTILYAEMPVKTNLRVTHSEPGLKGDTATNATKPATLETGVEVRVPLFINEGDLIQIDTRDGSYLNRVKE